MGTGDLNLIPREGTTQKIVHFRENGGSDENSQLFFSDEISDFPFVLGEVMSGCATDECVLVGIADTPLEGKKRALIEFSISQSKGRFLS